MPKPPLRAQVALLTDRGRVQVTSASHPESFRPDGWQWLYAWIESGWVPFYLTGNGERGFALLLEQHWGDPMRLATFVAVKEKDDGTIKIKACTTDVPGIPDNWADGLAAWTKDGWELSHVTGNREHGWGWLLNKAVADEAAK